MGQGRRLVRPLSRKAKLVFEPEILFLIRKTANVREYLEWSWYLNEGL